MSDTRKEDAGRRSFLAGQAAEAAVARHYEAQGADLAADRWRGAAGEIDLIFRHSSGLIFVEVKQSRTVAQAAAHVSPRQVRRLLAAAEEFAGGEPQGLLTEMRFDVALVDGQGQVHILENALMGG